MTKMVIRGLSHCPEQNRAVLLLEYLDRRRQLTFLVPMNEANRLARALGLTPCACIPVFELVEGLLAHFEARVRRVVLNGSEQGVSGTLYVWHENGEAAFPCHPADALALAKRAGAPIYATDEALRHACPLDQPHSHLTSHADVKGWLERVRPENFEG